MADLDYEDYWFNYVLKEDPIQIKELIREGYIESQGLKIHLDIYDDINSEREKTVIFSHGTSVYSRFYAEWCYNLYQNGFRVIAPDMPGHGMSRGKRGHFTMEMFTKTMLDVNSWVIDNFGERNAVMGSSLGGINALYSVARDDDRLKAAVCHNAAIFNEKGYKNLIKMGPLLRFLRPLVPIASKIAPKLKLSVWLYLDFYKLAKSQELINKVPLILEDKRLSDKYTLTGIRTQMKDSLAKPIEKIKTPVMIINGDEDYLFSVDYMTEIFERLTCPEKRLEIIEGASHLIFQENIETALERIVPWLNKIM